MTKKKLKKSKTDWIIQQRKDVSKVFAPRICYDEEYDILSITWFPQLNCIFSLETNDDIIFDISEGEKQVKGIQIINFKKRFLIPLKQKVRKKIKNARTNTKKAKAKRRKRKH